VRGSSTTVLITGSAGFVGSHLVELFLSETDWQIVGLDSFRQAGDSSRISSASLSSGRYRIYTCDLSVPISRTLRRQIGSVDIILNMASSSSVDYSLHEPDSLIRNNIGVALTMLEFARDVNPRLFMHMSTDEVYGSAANDVRFAEWSTIRPSNPYSASKAAQEAIAFSYWRSFGVPLLLVNTTNIIGERQDVGKFVPLVVSSLMSGRVVEIHCASGKPGSRVYLHVSDCVRAIRFLVDHCVSGEIAVNSAQPEPPRFNIVGVKEVDNLALACGVARILGTELKYREVEVLGSRPGHDLRYALDPSKLTALGWTPLVPFEEALERTVKWFISNTSWL
jgi:dTDP-glucose 4,6-dehydratase